MRLIIFKYQDQVMSGIFHQSQILPNKWNVQFQMQNMDKYLQFLHQVQLTMKSLNEASK